MQFGGEGRRSTRSKRVVWSSEHKSGVDLEHCAFSVVLDVHRSEFHSRDPLLRRDKQICEMLIVKEFAAACRDDDLFLGRCLKSKTDRKGRAAQTGTRPAVTGKTGPKAAGGFRARAHGAFGSARSPDVEVRSRFREQVDAVGRRCRRTIGRSRPQTSDASRASSRISSPSVNSAHAAARSSRVATVAGPSGRSRPC